MTKVEVEKALKDEYEYAAKEVLRYGTRMSGVEKARPILEALLAIPGHEHVGVVSVSGNWKAPYKPTITLYLRDSAKASPFVREIVKALHIPAKKTPSGNGILCEFDILGVTLSVMGYLPEDCRIEYVEEVIPAHTERRSKVICKKEDENE